MLEYTALFAALLMVTSGSPLMSRIPPQSGMINCVHYSCGTDDKVKNVHLTSIPDPPQLHKEVEIFISGTLTEQVNKGTVQIKHFFGTREVAENTYDLCNLAPNWNMTCPIHPGHFNFICTTAGVVVPVMFPVVYSAVMNVTDENDNVLTCVKAHCMVSAN